MSNRTQTGPVQTGNRQGEPDLLCPVGGVRCCADPGRHPHHDRLLAVETDTDELLELVELAVTWSELDYSHATLIPPSQWIDFAARHQWRDPERAMRIFSLATDIALRSRPEGVLEFARNFTSAAAG